MFANHKLISWLPLLPLALLLACKKDEANPDTTGIRLFTNKMEITDVAVKTRFLNRAPADFRQLLPGTTTDQVKFSAPDTATFGASRIKFVATKSNDQYIFRSPAVVQLSSTTMLLHDMLKYTAPIYQVPTASGFGSITSEVRVGYDRGNQLQLSYLQYYWRNSQGWYSGTLFNELNESVVSKVSATDTLAVRQGSLSAVLVR